MDKLWYAGYGSNLNQQRYFCYLRGGKPDLGDSRNTGCGTKTELPVRSERITIPYALYFALFEGRIRTTCWGEGGVAFIRPQKDSKEKTYCRIWPIQKADYEKVRDQEGRETYNKEIVLGEKEGIPIVTISHAHPINHILAPSETYLKTIIIGLKETLPHTNDHHILNYLASKNGIRGKILPSTLKAIISSVTSKQ